MVGDARGYRMVMAAIGRFLRIIPFPMDDSMDDSMIPMLETTNRFSGCFNGWVHSMCFFGEDRISRDHRMISAKTETARHPMSSCLF